MPKKVNIFFRPFDVSFVGIGIFIEGGLSKETTKGTEITKHPSHFIF